MVKNKVGEPIYNLNVEGGAAKYLDQSATYGEFKKLFVTGGAADLLGVDLVFHRISADELEKGTGSPANAATGITVILKDGSEVGLDKVADPNEIVRWHLNENNDLVNDLSAVTHALFDHIEVDLIAIAFIKCGVGTIQNMDKSITVNSALGKSSPDHIALAKGYTSTDNVNIEVLNTIRKNNVDSKVSETFRIDGTTRTTYNLHNLFLQSLIMEINDLKNAQGDLSGNTPYDDIKEITVRPK